MEFAVARYNADGSLDNNFSGDGMQTVDFGDDDFAYGVVLNAGGRIVLAGAANNGSNYDTAVARLKKNGNLDSNFSGDGKEVVDVGNDDFASAVRVQPNERIVTAGRMDNGSNDDFAVLRFKSDGTQDTSFNGTGVNTFDFNGGDDDANAMALVGDDKIVVAGPAFDGSAVNFGLARLKQDGTLDPSSTATAMRSARASAARCSASPTGSPSRTTASSSPRATRACSSASTASSPSNGSLAAARSTWGSRASPAVSSPRSGAATRPRTASRIGADGRVLAAGSTYNGSDTDFALARYKPTGALKTNFGTGGIVTTDFGSGNDVANALLVDANGKIVVVGSASNGSDLDFAVARYNADGSLDTSFDTDGKVTTDFGSGDDSARAVAVQPDGKLVVAGYAANGTDDDFAVARYNTDGSLDTCVRHRRARAGTTSATGTTTRTRSSSCRTGRSSSAGTRPEPRTSTSGSPGSSPAARSTRATGRTASSPRTSAPETTGSPGSPSSRTAWSSRQAPPTTAPDNDFGLARYTTSGVARHRASAATGPRRSRSARATTRQAPSSSNPTGGSWPAASPTTARTTTSRPSRFKDGGNADGSFGNNGVVTTDFTSSKDQAFALTLAPGGRLVAAGSKDNGSDLDFALARYDG